MRDCLVQAQAQNSRKTCYGVGFSVIRVSTGGIMLLNLSAYRYQYEALGGGQMAHGHQSSTFCRAQATRMKGGTLLAVERAGVVFDACGVCGGRNSTCTARNDKANF